MPSTLQTMIFRYNYKSNNVFIPLIHYKVYLTALKIRNWNEQSREHTVLMYSTAYNLWTFTWFVHFEHSFRLKGTEKIHTERFFKFPSIYSILYDCITYLSLNTDVYWLVVYSTCTIEHAVENIAYYSFQLISVTLLSLPEGWNPFE